jgi:hypothetical protein
LPQPTIEYIGHAEQCCGSRIGSQGVSSCRDYEVGPRKFAAIYPIAEVEDEAGRYTEIDERLQNSGRCQAATTYVDALGLQQAPLADRCQYSLGTEVVTGLVVGQQ